jgi:hypothetical protein
VLAGPVRIRIPYSLGSAWNFTCRVVISLTD